MTKTRKSRETERSKYWRGVVQEWEASGMTQVSFCQERDVSPAAFSWWRSEFKRRDRKVETGIQPSNRCKNPESHEFPFVQVSVPETMAACSPPERIEIILTSGHQIRVPQEFSSETLQRVIEVLEAAC